MEVDKNLNRELSVERDRWDCPNYFCIIFTSESKWESVINYVGIWNDASYGELRQKLYLTDGGAIQFYNLKDKLNEEIMMDIMGLELTTSIIDTSVIHKLNCQMQDFPLYVMTRMRSESKYDSRVVVI